MRNPDFSRERIHYAAAGVFVFLIAIFAAIFTGYAISIFTPNPKIYCSAAVIWAIFVFCLDRQIVMSIRKTDGALKQFVMALPRLVIAGFIGIVIGKPIELWMFRREINDVLINREEKRQQEAFDGVVKRIQSHNAPIQKDMEERNAKIEALRQRYKEIQDTETQLGQKVDTHKDYWTQVEAQRVRDVRMKNDQSDLKQITKDIETNTQVLSDEAQSIEKIPVRPIGNDEPVKPAIAHQSKAQTTDGPGYVTPMRNETEFGLLERIEALDPMKCLHRTRM
jgi:hypothetical protein